MNYFQSIILGLVEGITEYLPVSSTGHLILTQKLLGIEENAVNNAYIIAIQGGAILAVLTLYRHRFWQLLSGLLARDRQGFILLRNLLVAFLPAAVLGVLFDKKIETYLFGMWPVVVAWIAGGVVILLLPAQYRMKKGTIEKLTWRQSLLIGFIQCMAMWPGVSRSLATMLGGVLVGLGLSAAIEFSFLLGVITLTAASGFKLLQHGHELLAQNDWGVLLAGFVMSFITAWAAVKWLVGYLQKHDLTIFAWWRILLGAGIAAAMVLHILAAAMVLHLM